MIVHKTRTQLALEALREKILSGEIKAGEPLRQAALASSLNVSRIPIREALLQLEAEGLVKFEPHKGAIATELSIAQVEELFELRALLECELLKYSIQNLEHDDFSEAEDVMQQMDLKNNASPAAASELNYRFHSILYRKANRPQTAELTETLIKNSLRYIRIHLSLAGGDESAQNEHRELLELCKQKDSKNAVKHLKKHIVKAKKDLIRLIRATNQAL